MAGKKADKWVMCPHCKYAYPAALQRCNLCGYPWPWLQAAPKKRRPNS